MWRRIRRIVLALAALIGMGVLVVGWSVWASLPTLDGVLAHQAIARPVRIDRDALGVVTVVVRCALM